MALVLLEIMPELAESQTIVARAVDSKAHLENHVYIVALIWLATFYAMERIIKTSRGRQRQLGEPDRTSDSVFWLTMAVVGTKNLTVGYVIAREPQPVSGLVVFTLALALEFTVGDRGMHEDHKANYDRIGWWVLAAVLGAGWIAGLAAVVPALGVTVLSAFLAGTIVLNVFKEELPEERESRSLRSRQG